MFKRPTEANFKQVERVSLDSLIQAFPSGTAQAVIKVILLVISRPDLEAHHGRASARQPTTPVINLSVATHPLTSGNQESRRLPMRSLERETEVTSSDDIRITVVSEFRRMNNLGGANLSVPSPRK